MFVYNRNISRQYISIFAIFALLLSNVIFTLPAAANEAGGEEGATAHTVNVFDIDIKQGAEHYSQYVPSDPSQSGTQSLEDVYVWQADSSNEGHQFVYNIVLSVSGEGTTDQPGGEDETGEAVKAGAIEIRIPAHILKYKGDNAILPDRNGVYPDEAEMPVPDAELIEHTEVVVTDGEGNPVLDDNGQPVTETVYTATSHEFAYKLDDKGTPEDQSDDEYVIYNIVPVSAGVVYEFPVAYKMTHNTWDYMDLESSEPCSASVTVKSWEQDDPDKTEKLVTAATREIPVYIDTAARIDSTAKKAEAIMLTAGEAETMFGVSGLDENYRYAIWTVSSDISGVTQRYALDISDVPADLTGTDASGTMHSVAGEFVAAKMGGQLTDSLSGLTASGKRTDYVLTRYAYSSDGENEGIETLYDAPKNAIYTAGNSVTVTLTPADGQDAETSAASSASFRFEVKDPVWQPVVTRYSIDKWGLFNNGSLVEGKQNVSSYQLADLLEDEPVSGLKYKTRTTAVAYGKTVRSLNNEITEMVVPTSIVDGKADIIAGCRKYSFDTDGRTCLLTVYTDDSQTEVAEIREIDISGVSELTLLEMQKIAAEDIAYSYYGQSPVEYILTDKTFALGDKDVSAEDVGLDENDYRIDSFSFVYKVRAAVYDRETMEFSSGEVNAGLSDTDEYNTLDIYVYNNGSDTPVLAGRYNIKTGQASDIDTSLIRYISAGEVVFADSANVTGYQIKTKNDYYSLELVTIPSVTLKPSDKVKTAVEPLINSTESEKKIALRNTVDWNIRHDDGTELADESRTATDYIADIVRESSISKKALGEKTAVKGRDGKTYRSRNDTLSGQYELVWQTKVSETADGIEVDGVFINDSPVPQQSGIFYDLLPAHCDIIEGSVNVYADPESDNNGDIDVSTVPLAPSSFEVLDRIDNYNGSGKKLLIIKINAPCQKSYAVTYATVHSHEDIQDYGSYALNTVAYQTGNADIGDGYPDDGGNYAVSMSNYIKDLDPDNNGARRFIYAESTEDILALFPTSSGVYKKVSTKTDPVFGKTGTVHNGELYTYSIRMKNDPVTKARNIAFLDSVENYRTSDEMRYNAGLSYDRDWHGTIESFDLRGLEDKLTAYSKVNSSVSADDLRLFLYVSDDPETDIADFESEDFNSSEQRSALLEDILSGAQGDGSKWQEADDWRDLSAFDMTKVTAFIIYMGENFVLGNSDSMAFTVKMRAPDNVQLGGEADPENGVFLRRPMTYNNIYRSFYTIPKQKGDDEQDDVTYFYTHYDYTQVHYSTVGTLRFTKADSKTGEPIKGVEFSLSGISDYGTVYSETLVSDGNGVVEFRDLERGSYQLIESVSDDDHLLDPTPRSVNVDPQGSVTIVTVDGVVVDDGAGHYTIYNKPRYHSDLVFRKVDSLSGKGVKNTVFTLRGISLYQTEYDLTAESDADGNVVFRNIEKGTYTLTETAPADGYLPPSVNTYSITSVGEDDMVFNITGESVERNSGEYLIKNEPTARLTLEKIDSVAGTRLDDAGFTLKADSSLNGTISNLTAAVSDTGWVRSGDGWVQTLSGSNSSVAGLYSFGYLPKGTYTLTETAPRGYAAVPDITLEVRENSAGKKYIVVSGDTENTKYVLSDGSVTDADNADYLRISDAPSFEEGKTVIKSWYGGTGEDGKFPVFHLSTEKPEGAALKVTIDKTKFRSLVNANKGAMTGLVRDNSLPAGVSDTAIEEFRDSSYPDETGRFYAWFDPSDNKLHWWSDANVIYMPPDCSGLFENCTAAQSIDISEFDSDKVTKVIKMFNNCSNLETLKFGKNSQFNSVTNSGLHDSYWNTMFTGLKKLQNFEGSQYLQLNSATEIANLFLDVGSNVTNNTLRLDLSGMTGSSGKNLNKMFMNCGAKYIDLSNLNADNATSAGFLFNGCTQVEEIVLNSTFNLNNINIGYRDCALFENTYKLERLVGSQYLELSNCRELSNMFFNCGRDSGGIEVLDLSGLKASNTTVAKAMFQNCNAKAIRLDNIESGNMTAMDNMFNGCKAERIYVDPSKWSTNGLGSSGSMFTNCSNIVGEQGTKYRSGNPQNATYARIDDPDNSRPGYFTNCSEYPKPVPSASGASVSATHSLGAGTRIFNSPAPLRTSSPSPYADYTPSGDPETEESYTPADGEKPGTTLSYEYVTGDTGTQDAEDPTVYTVPETVYLTATTVTDNGDGTFSKTSQKYVYDKPLTATWRSVGGTAPTQWLCEMNVQNADDPFYAWEDVVTGYTSTANKEQNTVIKTEGSDDQPVITNAKGSVTLGSLELSKKLTGTTGEKFSEDVFWFKVKLEKSDGTPYTMLPFNGSGEAYFKVRANASDDDRVIISGIPTEYKYTVTEVNENGHPMPDGYTVVTGTQSGDFSAGTAQKAVIENSIDAADLSISKQTELWKKSERNGPFVRMTAADGDGDEQAWSAREFAYTVTFTNLVKGQEYSYDINGTVQPDKLVGSSEYADTSVTVRIKDGETLTFRDIPAGTRYTIAEEQAPIDTGSVTYQVLHGAPGETGEPGTTASGTLGTEDTSVAYTNIKRIDLTAVPEQVDVTVNKEWYNMNGDLATWTTDVDGKLIAPEGSYPSFLKIYLGRALKVGEGDSAVYVNIEPGFTSYSLKAKEGWSYTFTELPKYGQLTLDNETVDYPYVYFVTEVVPIGFVNDNDASEYTAIGTEKYLTASVSGTGCSFTLRNKETATHELSVCKLVDGNMGSRTKDFDFEIEFRDSSGEPLTGTGFTMRFTDLYDSSYERNRTYTLENGSISIGLRHGMKVEFTSLPEGTQYSIRELPASGYNTVSGAYTGAPEDQDAAALAPVSEYGSPDMLTLDADADYLYVNTRSVLLPTGVVISFVTPLLMLIAVLGAMYFLRRNRTRYGDDARGADAMRR